MHSEQVKDLYHQCRKKNSGSFNEQIFLQKIKCIPSKTTFIHYKPNYIDKNLIIAHMTCDNCTQFKFIWMALLSVLKKHHKCTSEQNCYINDFNSINVYSKTSLNIFCCNNCDVFPLLKCAEGCCGCSVIKLKNY